VSLDRLRAAWERSDRLFCLLGEDAWLEQPIPLRQPFLFYLGHLPAFAWNHLGRGLLGRPAFRADFDSLFERGIDPVGVDAYVPRASWPERPVVVEYRHRVRTELERALSDPAFPSEGKDVVAMVVEHELMHHETLLYMVQELRHDRKRRPANWPGLPPVTPAPPARTVEIPGGEVVLGAPRGSLPFGWDNEFEEQRFDVARFAIDERPVTNTEFLEFVRDGGYAEPRLWREEDWAWRERRGLVRPHSWRGADDDLRVRSLLEDVPFACASSWPVQASWAEAAAYAKWRGARLPTEAEWRRAAHGSPSGPRRWPWGDSPLPGTRANAHFRHGSPLPAGSRPAGASAWGVLDLVGNGWEWTATPFGPLPGFAPMPRYPGYSADFFDGRHFVLLGGSWATDEALLRPSFRNWFQPHYPYAFTALRCVCPGGG
jgi:ergothioneine biosynthesis protein EgtB